MFTTLLESRAQRARRTHSTVVSLVLHSAVIAMAVAVTRPTLSAAHEDPMEKPTIWVDVLPTPPETQLRRATTTTTAHPIPDIPRIDPPTFVPKDLPPIDATGPVIPDDRLIIGRPLSTDRFVGGPSTGMPSGSIVDETLVDRAPRLLGDAKPPQYPSLLRQSGVTGQVVVQFVVDTLGRAETEGVQIVEASHTLFADAVRAALTSYRFSAGEAAGHKVRTRVQLPFTFSLR
jgi:TonB family protein